MTAAFTFPGQGSQTVGMGKALAEASAEAVDLCCRAAGGHALFDAHPFGRALRDVRAAIAQITLQRTAMEDAGRAAFGLEPLSPVF